MAQLRALIVASALLLSSGVPASAQEQSGLEAWIDWGSQIAHEAVDAAASPFRKAWVMAWEFIGSTEAQIAEEKAKFAQKLKGELESFSKDVERTGFDVSTISISPDIIPKISLTLEVREPVSEAVEAQLRTEFQNEEKYGLIERTLLLGLLDLDEAAADLKVEGYAFSDVELELVAIFPEVTLNFERENSDPEVSTPESGTSDVLTE